MEEIDMREQMEREIANVERKIELAGEVIDMKTKEVIQLKKEMNIKLRAKAAWFHEKANIKKPKKAKRVTEEKATQMQDENIKIFRGEKI
jgi:hypothetical protein